MSASDLATLQGEFKNKSTILLDRTPWQPGVAWSKSDQESFKELQDIAKEISAEPESSLYIVQSLDFYKDHDGYARQALFQGIINGRKYEKSDLDFLKKIFLFSFGLKAANYPPRLRLWMTPDMFRYHLAFIVTGVLNAPGPASLNRDPDRNLFNSDPKSWIERKIP